MIVGHPGRGGREGGRERGKEREGERGREREGGREGGRERGERGEREERRVGGKREVIESGRVLHTCTCTSRTVTVVHTFKELKRYLPHTLYTLLATCIWSGVSMAMGEGIITLDYRGASLIRGLVVRCPESIQDIKRNPGY